MAKKWDLVVVEHTIKIWSQTYRKMEPYRDYRVAIVGSATRDGLVKTVRYPTKTGLGDPMKVDRSSEVVYTLPPIDKKRALEKIRKRGSYSFDTKEEVKNFLRPFVKR